MFFLRGLVVRSIFLILVFLGFLTDVFPNKINVRTKAPNVILMNGKSGQVIYEKNAYDIVYPASLTKVATGLYALEKKSDSLSEMIKASPEALERISPEKKVAANYTLPPYLLETDGHSFGLLKGESMPLKDLLNGVLIDSGNDAANVVAEYISGTIPNFMSELNQFLQKIGCKNTTFCNPSGLHHPDHQTTAYDLAILTKKSLENQYFRGIVGTKTYYRPRTNLQTRKELASHNRLLIEGPHYFPYAMGGKTGYHSKAKYTLISAAEKEGRLLIAVILGSDMSKDRYNDAKALFNVELTA